MRVGSQSMEGFVRHIGGSVASVFNGNLWERKIIYFFWIVFSPLLRRIGPSERRRQGPENPRNVLLLDNHGPTRVHGPDITHGIYLWCKLALGAREIKICTDVSELPQRTDANTILVLSHDYLFDLAMRKDYIGALRIMRISRKNKLRIWIFLADLCWLRMTLLSSILVAGTGGLHPVLTNSNQAARKYGIPNIIGPIFWTLPELERSYPTMRRWDSKRDLAIGSESGDPRRVAIVSRLLPAIEKGKYSFFWSNSREVPYEKYISLLEASKVAIVPGLLQEEFQKGPARYRKRLPKTIVTGRMLETIATRTALVTNLNENLEDWGFKAGEHYVVLPEKEDEIRAWSLPPDDELANISRMAFKRWRVLLRDQASLLP